MSFISKIFKNKTTYRVEPDAILGFLVWEDRRFSLIPSFLGSSKTIEGTDILIEKHKKKLEEIKKLRTRK